MSECTARDVCLVLASERYAKARRQRAAAKKQRLAYWLSVADAPNAHHYGQCTQCDGPLCAVCVGSQPFHEACTEAGKEQGSALRLLMRLAEQGGEGGG